MDFRKLTCLQRKIKRKCIHTFNKYNAENFRRISQKLDIVVFQSWNPDVVAFCLLKKWLGMITMSWINCLCFSMSWCLSPRVSMSRLFGLGISMLWFFGLGISMSCFMCLHGLVFVLMQIVLIILLKNILLIQIYATATRIIHA